MKTRNEFLITGIIAIILLSILVYSSYNLDSDLKYDSNLDQDFLPIDYEFERQVKAVLDFCEKYNENYDGPIPLIGIRAENNTHYIDNGTCEWRLKIQ